MKWLGVTRHPTKGEWEGARRLDHLGVHIDTVAMKVYVAERKVVALRKLASKVLAVAQKNKRLVPMALLRHFCSVCVSLTLGLPMARFYTRSIYFDMSLASKRMIDWGEVGG